MPIVDPVAGIITGTLDVAVDGAFTFTPAPGFTGPAPVVLVTVQSSDGQAKDIQLSATVTPLLRVGSTSLAGVAGSSVHGNVLDAAVPPPGTTATVTSFTLPNGGTFTAGPSPVPLKDPVTQQDVGTVVLMPNGTTIFTPAPSWSGMAPPISVAVSSSDGQVVPSVLTINIEPGKLTVNCGSSCVTVVVVACHD